MERRSISLACMLALAVAGCGGFAPDLGGGGSDGGGGGGVQPHFSSLYGDYFGNCGSCHAPAAPGRTSNIEESLDFTSASTAYASLKGMASGLQGNVAACNGVPFLGTTASGSLVYAVLDAPTRTAFDVSSAPGCDQSAISDETIKVGSEPSAEFMAALKDWIDAGAVND